MTARIAGLSVVAGLLWATGSLDAFRFETGRDQFRTSWTAFAADVEAFAATSRSIPTASLTAMWTGVAVPDSEEVMRRFGGPVTFDGVLSGIETRNLLPGKVAKIRIDTARPRWGWRVHVYPRSDALAAWEATPIGTTVTFQAVVTGISRMPPEGVFPDNGYVVLLEDATVVTGTAQTIASARMKWADGKIDSYEYTFQLTCLCRPELQQPVTFRVTAGRSAQMTRTDDETRRMMERYGTIDKLFGLLQAALADQPGTWTARFDDRLGLPLSASVTRHGPIVDDTVSFAVTGFRVIKP